MATGHAAFHSSKLMFTALIALALQLLGTHPLDRVAVLLNHVLCCMAGEFFGGLPGMITSVIQTTETYALSHAGLVFVVQALAQSWPLLRFIFNAA
jgi:hypothetical protein